ncbi:Rieske (2Fe-2S) protein [Cryptosporangium sp. NPDC048952]|uniref:Rieske (2Fe-2S) protein n=1 Tax=Cryptosporangium sp. NPDC048952 TaxID=3363961 RepID=UPI00372007D2
MGENRAVTRRSVVAGAGAFGVTATLGACSSYGDDGSDSATTTASTAAATSAPASASAAASATAGTTASPAGTELGPSSEVPVGGGKIYASEKIVVTQPTAGTYKGFSAVCTHQGCTVSTVTGGKIICNCHKSHFSATDGSVVSGPAKTALPSESVTVSGDTVYLA